MRPATEPRVPRWVRVLIALNGLLNLGSGIALLVAPAWFFENVGNFPPFNRHYMGDAGAFVGAIGLGLLLAARDPLKHRLTVAVGAVAGVVHTLNHLVDDFAGGQLSLVHFLPETLPLALFAGMLLAAYWILNRS